ncbi:DUF551 domain-containing protein [Xenorhabdus sp. M]|uniref:DUF551 domain-containing protein n=1 Tax=Xenorhabdus szentirmaii TaxID=290112 RepID=A0AAW3YYB4_9GAMM|nr:MULTISPECIES: DUF551 domain-containing protein [unclassified Xenorhabdus]MBD2803055.1 DUF551 domain-containing protein [Xenorhabdus sp. M]MBD2804087.1 DUF551 domain-containing protein [Xenorhabdus sp. ZM]
MEWIKCSERLPEIRDDSVIVYFSHGSMDMVHIEDYFCDVPNGEDEHGNQLYIKPYEYRGITHWMDFPQSPTGE